jgi:hypothetical protein
LGAFGFGYSFADFAEQVIEAGESAGGIVDRESFAEARFEFAQGRDLFGVDLGHQPHIAECSFGSFATITGQW